MLDGSMTVHWAEARFAPEEQNHSHHRDDRFEMFHSHWNLDIDDVVVGLLRVDTLSFLIFEIHCFGIIEEDAEW